jgi:hypothetical protein
MINVADVLSAVGCWLLAIGCWLLAVGCRLSVLTLKNRHQIEMVPRLDRQQNRQLKANQSHIRSQLPKAVAGT